jgi:hypothetical protein
MPAKVMVPKGRTVVGPPRPQEFDREALLAKLFALPVPPQGRGHRRFPTHTPLGRIMRLRELSVRQVSAMSPDVPHVRTMTEYLAGRKAIRGEHRRALAKALGVDARVF